MRINVQGVIIELTPEQISKVEKGKAALKKESTSFTSVLKAFGFKKIPDSENSWHNPEKGWYADLINYGTYHEVWMTGSGLRSYQGFPGGWNYGTPSGLAEELSNAQS